MIHMQDVISMQRSSKKVLLCGLVELCAFQCEGCLRTYGTPTLVFALFNGTFCTRFYLLKTSSLGKFAIYHCS